MNIQPRLLLSSVLVLELGGCVVSTEAVPGPPGSAGKDGTSETIAEASCSVGAYVAGIDDEGNIICSPGSDVSALQQQIQGLTQQVADLHAALDTGYVEVPGSATGPDFSFVIPLSKLGGGFRTVLLTIRASGASCILARTYLVHTGNGTGVSVGEIGVSGSYNVGAVTVTGNLGFNNFDNQNSDDAEGVTVAFSMMPPEFIYRYSVTRVGTQQ